MPFEKFKAAHGGEGPLQTAYHTLAPEGLLGRRGLADERQQTNDIVSRVKADSDVSGALEAVVQQATRPLTREQHQQIRAQLLTGQASIHDRMNLADQGLAGLSQQVDKLRGLAVSKEDLTNIDGMGAAAKYAHSLALSLSPENQQRGFTMLENLYGTMKQYTDKNEDQRLQLEAAAASGRETRRKEIQDFVDTRFVAPAVEDRANYSAILSQLTGHGDEVAPPTLTTAVLEYAGAQLQQSGEGAWSFRVGGVGYKPEDTPRMTYSQLRNQLNAAHGGRQQSLQSGVADYAKGAEQAGFGINGPRVDDLMFPLANEAMKSREKEALAGPAGPEKALDVASDVAATAAESTAGFFGQMGSNTADSLETIQKLFSPRTQPTPEARRANERNTDEFGRRR